MASFSQSQVDIGNIILQVGREMGVTDKQMQAAFAAGYAESGLQNLNYGDRDSVGVFQQRPSQGWGTITQILDPYYAARKFFEVAQTVSQSGTVGQLAQRVQRSAYPSRYDEALNISNELLNRLTGSAYVPISSNQSIPDATGDSVSIDDNAWWIVLGLGAIILLS